MTRSTLLPTVPRYQRCRACNARQRDAPKAMTMFGLDCRCSSLTQDFALSRDGAEVTSYTTTAAAALR